MAREALRTPSSTQEFVEIAFLLLTGICWELNFLPFALLFSKRSTVLLFTDSLPFDTGCSYSQSNIYVQKPVNCTFLILEFFLDFTKSKGYALLVFFFFPQISHSTQHVPQHIVGALFSALLCVFLGQNAKSDGCINGCIGTRQTRP